MPVDTILQQAQGVLSGRLPLSLEFAQVIYQPLGWYFLIVKPRPWMLELQDVIMQGVGGHILPSSNTQKDTSGYSASELKSFRTFGYRYVGSAFLPHITLGKNAQSPSTDLILRDLNTAWTALGLHEGLVQGLTFYRMGEYGAHQETVKEITIG